MKLGFATPSFVPLFIAASSLVLATCGASDAEQSAAIDSATFQEPEQIGAYDTSEISTLPIQVFQLEDAVNGVAFLNDEHSLAIALNRELLLLDIESEQERWRTTPCRSCSTVHLSRSPDGAEIVMPSRDRGGGAIYAPRSGEKIRDLSGPGYRAASAPDGSEILTVLELEAVLEAPGADSPIWHSNVEKIGALAYAPNGEQFVISADGDGSPRKGGKVLIFDAETREVETLIEYARGSFNHLAFSPDSGRLVLGSYKDRVLVWDMATNAPHCRFNSDDSGQGLRAFKLSPSGQLIATGGGTDNWGYVRIWDTQTCRLQAETILEDRVGSLSFHPHTPFLVAGAWSGEVAIIDLSELKP